MSLPLFEHEGLLSYKSCEFFNTFLGKLNPVSACEIPKLLDDNLEEIIKILITEFYNIVKLFHIRDLKMLTEFSTMIKIWNDIWNAFILHGPGSDKGLHDAAQTRPILTEIREQGSTALLVCIKLWIMFLIWPVLYVFIIY